MEDILRDNIQVTVQNNSECFTGIVRETRLSERIVYYYFRETLRVKLFLEATLNMSCTSAEIIFRNLLHQT